MTQDREGQWRKATAAITQLVAARADPHSHQAPRVPVWHDGKPAAAGSVLLRRGHATGAAVVLSLEDHGVFGVSDEARVVMTVEADASVEGAAVDSPPVPWFAHAVTCAGCSAVVKIRGEKLLSGAVGALATKGADTATFRIYV